MCAGRRRATASRSRPYVGPPVVAYASSRTQAALEQPLGADGIAARGVRQGHADLGETLPQVALSLRAGLPARLEHLVRRERPPGLDQLAGSGQRLGRRQRLLGHRLDPHGVVGQRPPELVAGPRLARATESVAVASLGHRARPGRGGSRGRR